MSSIFDVAKYILQQQGKISIWKLQKLCYYAQAWNLAWTGTPLFDEDFTVGTNGPVCRELMIVNTERFTVGRNDIPSGNTDHITTEQKENIDIVLRDYGPMEPYDLRELSQHESPWKDTAKHMPKGEKWNTVITKDNMAAYYRGLLEQEG